MVPMKSFAVTTSIQASPEAVWTLLTDASGYVRWNNTVEKVDGRIAPGESVTVHPKINPGRAFPVIVSEFQPVRRMAWTGAMPLGLFKGERIFLLTPQPGGRVEFSMREVYTGWLAWLIGKSIPDLQPAFDEFASDLKRASETR